MGGSGHILLDFYNRSDFKLSLECAYLVHSEFIFINAETIISEYVDRNGLAFSKLT
jgi:hypothetical protein